MMIRESIVGLTTPKNSLRIDNKNKRESKHSTNCKDLFTNRRSGMNWPREHGDSKILLFYHCG